MCPHFRSERSSTVSVMLPSSSAMHLIVKVTEVKEVMEITEVTEVVEVAEVE
jgi:hypothetical protein